MELSLPQYSGKDYRVMLIIVPLFAIVFNLTNFSTQYFSDVLHFTVFTLVSVLAFGIYFIICGGIAVILKKRLPGEGQVMKRLSLTILVFLLTTALFLFAILRGYSSFEFFKYDFSEQGFLWSYLSLAIINVFLTFLMEGISRYSEWQKSRKETEKLNQAYKQGQLLGLKSHVNPHFLFNSLNSLSSLIHEDEDAAEKFLDEMSKVYRYMLRNDEEQLVPLDTELKFLDSYFYLLKSRYGDGLQLRLNIPGHERELKLAPLTLRVIIENAFSQNIISRANPLVIDISCTKNNLLVQYNLQPKSITDSMEFETDMDNLVRKYRLLNMPVTIYESETRQRFIQVPLTNGKREAAL